MTPPIVERLREPWTQEQSRRPHTEFEAADTIEELVEALERCRRFFVSNWSATGAESCLSQLDDLLTKIGDNK